jgi:hypothetical protein
MWRNLWGGEMQVKPESDLVKKLEELEAQLVQSAAGETDPLKITIFEILQGQLVLQMQILELKDRIDALEGAGVGAPFTQGPDEIIQ